MLSPTNSPAAPGQTHHPEEPPTAMHNNRTHHAVTRPVTLFGLLMLLCLSAMAQTGSENRAQDEAAIHALLDGLHGDAAQARFADYFSRFTPDAIFLGTDRSERWTMAQFKAYAAPVFEAGRGWTYHRVARHIEGTGDTRWFDEVLHNEKLGHCRGTGVVIRTPAGWRIAHYALTMLVPNSIAAEVGEQTQRAEATVGTQ